jgi:hypothetical protein
LYGVTVTVAVALLTVNVLVPLLAEYEPSPAKLAPTPVGYDPTLTPQRLTPVSVATPLPSVTAVPTDVPFRVKLMVLPLTPEAPDVSVAEKLVVPP